jgi:hypothetical protein
MCLRTKTVMAQNIEPQSIFTSMRYDELCVEAEGSSRSVCIAALVDQPG